jgi:predicted ester cyclase
VFEAEVTFTRPDGSVVTVPAVSILRVAPGAGGDPRVVDFRMTMDAAPVVAPAEGAAHVAADGPAEPHAHARAVALRFYDLLRGADPAPVDDVLAPAWVEYPPSAPGQAPGAAGFAPVLANFRATFPDLEAVVEDVLVDGDRVVVRSTLQGTHRGATYGLAPTGRRVAFMAIDIHRVAGERIAETWHVEDRLSLLTQLGALGGGGGTGGSARDAARGSDRGSDRDADRGADDAVRGEGAHV